MSRLLAGLITMWRPKRLRRCGLCIGVVFFLVSTGCRSFDPDYACVTRPYSVTKLVTDTPAVRRLLIEASARDAASDRSFLEQIPEEQLRIIHDKLSNP